MPRARIHGAEYPLEKVFGPDFSFVIPLYQRPYSWGVEHAEALLDDLLGAIGPSTVPMDGLNPYFFGSVVLVKSEHNSRAEVVDGQQRLTTLTILFSVLRHTLPSQYAVALAPHLYEQGNPITGTPNRPRLALRDRDQHFFEELVQRPGGLDRLPSLRSLRLPDSQTNIRDNAAALLARVQTLSEPQRLRLAQFLLQQCFLVVVSTPDFDSAYRIFSVLNDRGLDLSPADILKAEVIGAIAESEQERYGRLWEETEEGLGQEAFQELFAHIRMVHRRAKARDSLLTELRAYVQPSRHPKAFIENTLVPYARNLVGLKNGFSADQHASAEVDERLRWLNPLDNVDWIPVALMYVAKEGVQGQTAERFFADLERLAWSMFLRRSNINERMERYGRVLDAVERGDWRQESSPLQLTREERAETIHRLNGEVYLVPKTRLQLLLRIDALVSGGQARYAFAITTVEHVLPQNPNPSSQWVRIFPDAAQRGQLTHRLGNLALLSKAKNTAAQNYDFDVKKAKYFAGRDGVSPFALTTQVLAEDRWDEAVIRRRQATLVNRIIAHWRL